MRSSFTATTGLKLVRSPSVRHLAARRWLAVAGAVVSLAVAGGVLGMITAPHGTGETAGRTGPFSYFPTQ